MRSLKIGNLVITKKGLLTLCFGFFLTGIVLGGTIIANKNSSNILLGLFITLINWGVLFPTLKKEIISE
jgi:hypothetical protein